MSKFGTDFSAGIGVLKDFLGEVITYRDQDDNATSLSNVLWNEDDAGEDDDDHGRISTRTVRVTIDALDLASVDRRGTIERGSPAEKWVITSVDSNHGVHRLIITRMDRDDHTARQVRM